MLAAGVFCSSWHIAQAMFDHYGRSFDRTACQTVDGALHGGGGIEELELCPLVVR